MTKASTVFSEIHENDALFWITYDGAVDKRSAVKAYFDGGEETAKWLRHLLDAVGMPQRPFSLLDFASGYGRVTRHLARALPGAGIVASDIHPTAVQFLESCGVEAVLSSSVPEEFHDRRFDFILALSFFTHMPSDTWGRWLSVLIDRLEPDGRLIFTTHGEAGLRHMARGLGRDLEWDDAGFFFTGASEQADIENSLYGSTATSFDFVLGEINRRGAELVRFEENGAGYQDLFVVKARRSAPPRSCTGEAAVTPATAVRLAPLRKVESAQDCLFYHTMELPSLGLVRGQWDLRGSEKAYLGGIDLAGRSVLEIGPASGYLSFWMERQGARVTSFDIDENQKWDIVPFDGDDRAHLVAESQANIRKMNNSWWYARNDLGAQAKCLYGTVYDLDQVADRFDVVTLNAVLLHLRDPVLAMERAAARCLDTIVITEVSENHFAPHRLDAENELCLHLIPRAAKRGPKDGWWHLPSRLTCEILQILGFRSIVTTFHTAEFHDGHDWRFYTIVGRR